MISLSNILLNLGCDLGSLPIILTLETPEIVATATTIVAHYPPVVRTEHNCCFSFLTTLANDHEPIIS